MTEQTGGQTPAGWYPDGSGSLRYWDGSAWTEHTAPIPEAAAPAAAQPAAESQPAAQQAQAAAPAAHVDDPMARAAAGGAVGGAAASGLARNDRVAPAEQPFYRKPVVLIAGIIALVLIAAGAAFALKGGSDSSGGTPVAGAPATTAAPSSAPTTATATMTLSCQPSTFPVDKYPFQMTLTVTPTEITLTSKGSIRNTGPTIIQPGKYRFEAAVTVNGTPLQLIGPTNTTVAAGTSGGMQEVFPAATQPLTAKAAPPAGAVAPLTVVLNDLYFNNINNAPTGDDKLTNTFDARCNPSPQPNSAPVSIGLSVPPGAGGATAPSSVAPSVQSSISQ